MQISQSSTPTSCRWFITGFIIEFADLLVHYFSAGYNDVLLIPVGATNIVIRERKPTNNYLGNIISPNYYANFYLATQLQRSSTFFSSWLDLNLI